CLRCATNTNGNLGWHVAGGGWRRGSFYQSPPPDALAPRRTPTIAGGSPGGAAYNAAATFVAFAWHGRGVVVIGAWRLCASSGTGKILLKVEGRWFQVFIGRCVRRLARYLRQFTCSLAACNVL